MFKFSKEKLHNVMQSNFDILSECLSSNNIAHKWLVTMTLLLFLEYGLKYKTQQCGKAFDKQHTIKDLYDNLPRKVREDIRNNFESIKSVANANGYRFSESIGKLLDKYNEEYTYIRYFALEDKPIPKEKTMDYLKIFIIFQSIIQVTDIDIVVRMTNREILSISDSRVLVSLLPKQSTKQTSEKE